MALRQLNCRHMKAFLLEFSIVQVVKEVSNMSFLIICFALERSLCPQTVVMH